MSDKSKPSAKRRNPRRPIAPPILSQARKLAEQYQVVVLQEEGHWYAHGVEMPRVFGDGATVEKAVSDTREAMTLAAAALLEEGRRPPTPLTGGRRTEQVNVRLSADERMLLETAAKRRGYSGMSDFIRSVAVEAAT